MSQDGITEPKIMRGDFWIMKLDKEKQTDCLISQKIIINLDVDEWNPERVFNAIHKIMLELEKQK